MHVGGQEHFYLETNVTLAVPRGEDGEMELFVSTQSTAKTQVTATANATVCRRLDLIHCVSSLIAEMCEACFTE